MPKLYEVSHQEHHNTDKNITEQSKICCESFEDDFDRSKRPDTPMRQVDIAFTKNGTMSFMKWKTSRR